MKKILLTAVTAMLALGASAATPEDVRIYINPGHGSWTSNDRPNGTVKHGANNPSAAGSDTAGFFESNTNLLKGFAMLEKLTEYGVPFDRNKNQSNSNPARVGAALDLSQNIVMSHVKAGPYPTVLMGGDANLANAYNRNLSEIAAEVEMNNFDIFISIHSNANVDGDIINYPLIIYRGTDTEEGNAGSKALGQAVWPHLYGAGMPHQQWTATGTYSMTKMNIRGDMSFYGKQSSVTYDVTDPNYEFDSSDKFAEYDEDAGKVTFTGHLGAIKHGVPGFLAEGYFHTYQPARHRYMNDDVCAIEGETYAKGINDYFGWGKKESTGTVYGIVRDKNNKFSHTYYTPAGSSADVYKPLNNVEVKLKDGNGSVVATYKTDDEYNGAFVFKKVQPGNYSLESYDFKVEEANSTVFLINVENIQLNKKNQYNLFAGENLLRIDYPNIGGYEYVEKNPNQPFVADQDCVISFFVYGSSQISITTNSKYEYKNYDESIIDTPKYRQKILIKARAGFTFDMITDGRVFSSMSACEISEDNLYSTKQYNNISDFMLEEIKYGEDVRIPNIKVIIKNAQSEFFDINYIAIKQTQISEVDGEIL
jgi:hypothetical protein